MLPIIQSELTARRKGEWSASQKERQVFLYVLLRVFLLLSSVCSFLAFSFVLIEKSFLYHPRETVVGPRGTFLGLLLL